MTSSETSPLSAPATVPLPSADLITYRFDQTDKKFEELNNKLDLLSNNFVTKDEITFLREERDAKIAEINRILENYKWYWRSIVTAVLLALATAIAALVGKHF